MGMTMSKCNPLTNFSKSDFPTVPRMFVFGAAPFEGYTVYYDIIAFESVEDIIYSAREDLIYRLEKYNLLTLAEQAKNLDLIITETLGEIEELTEDNEITIYSRE